MLFFCEGFSDRAGPTQRPWPLQQSEGNGKEWLFVMLPLDLDLENEALALALANLRRDHQGPSWRSDGLP